MLRVTLPNQVSIWSPSAIEAAVLYREIVTESTYQSHGIVVPEGAIVFDVGANVGLLGVHLARTVTGVELHAFEPVPALFDALRRNLAEHAPGARTYNIGLSDRAGEATFEVDRFMTLASTMRPDVTGHASTKAPAALWLKAGLEDLQRVAPSPLLPALAAGLGNPRWRPFAVALLLPIAALLAARRRLFLSRPRCRLEPLSAIIPRSGVTRIDLLKVDVEGAEEQVIDGIGEHDWPLIRQLVIEVHDVDGRLARLVQTLERRGYRTRQAREDWTMHELMHLTTLYAIRADG